MKIYNRNKRNSAIANKRSILEHLRKCAYPLRKGKDLDPLINLVEDVHYTLLGEASHGTHEYYTWRTEITKRLIIEKKFSFIAVEGDWPDCYKINRFVKGYENAGQSAEEVLKSFNRWPTWMWANLEIVELMEWLKEYNKNLSPEEKVGFFGLDVYSLLESLGAIRDYLGKTDKKILHELEKALECFEAYGEKEGIGYSDATIEFSASCEKEVVHLLAEIRKKIETHDGDYEAAFGAEQNALIAVNAERYYRTMIKGGPASWNIRDRHMSHTLDRLMHFHGANARAIVWEHNSHIGDARATDMADHGMVNLGQIISEEQGEDDLIRVGFGSYQGTVVAGNFWGDHYQIMSVPPAQTGSWESLLHDAGPENKLIITNDLETEKFFFHPLGHRAIGVVYDKRKETLNNYVPSIIPVRYEAFIFLDHTTALHPLSVPKDDLQIPETFPWGT
ncbi:N/A [soil metagenome]